MSKIGFKRSPTTSTRPGTTKRARPTVPLPPPPFVYADSLAPRPPQPTTPTPEKLAELHAAAFSALRSAVEANDDGLVRRMREWEDRYARRRCSAPAAPTPSSRRRRRRLASDPEAADMQLARALPLPAADGEDDDDDDDDQLIIHTSPGAGLASCPPRPAPAPMAVDAHAPAANWASAPLPAFTNPFTARRIADAPRHAHNYVAYRNSSSCTSSDDDEDMVWESSSSPYLSATTAASSDADADVDELGFQLAAGCGAIEDYSVDAILALQMQAAAAGRA